MLWHRRSVAQHVAVVFVALLLPAAPARAVDESYTFNGTIMSAVQFDLYPVMLGQGAQVVATLTCDEISPGDRPLDPVLSAFTPGVDASDINNAFVRDDDSLLSVPCNAFHSAIIRFVAPVGGIYNFRADGFGSSTGPYTMQIDITNARATAPLLDRFGLALIAGLLFAAGWRRVRRSA